MASSERILIAGGGIGGLTAALCLVRAGFEVAVFEQASEFGEIGAGIQLSPNCSRVLHHLGLAPQLEKCAFLPEGTEFRAWNTGRLIASSTLGESVRERYGAPYYHIHRGDLLDVLVQVARHSGAIELRESARVEGFVQDADGVRVTVNGRAEEGDALVGADGIHSTIRAALFGPEAPTFTGNLAWRALVPADRLPRGMPNPVATVWWGPGRHFVCYYLRGGSLLNCVCVVEKEGWELESWTERGEHAELKGDFAGWHEHIGILIDNMDRDSLYKWALYDRPPMARWGAGAVTLLGDACHPTLPFMAQGAGDGHRGCGSAQRVPERRRRDCRGNEALRGSASRAHGAGAGRFTAQRRVLPCARPEGVVAQPRGGAGDGAGDGQPVPVRRPGGGPEFRAPPLSTARLTGMMCRCACGAGPDRVAA